MFVIIYQLILFGIKPIRKRVLHWLDEASEATDFKPYIINSELYLGVTCVTPFIGFINGVVHFGIFIMSIFHIDIMSPFKQNDHD